jgi:methyl-accepting chemotaxis protein
MSSKYDAARSMTSLIRDAGQLRRVSPGLRFVAPGLSLVAIGIVAATIWALFQTSALQRDTAEIVDNMLTSVRLLGEVQTAVYRRQLLINRHILASSVDEMHEVETELVAVDRKVSVAMRAYEPWVTLPGEREAWDRTRAHLSTLDEPVARALALSRRNEDKAARDAMDGVENRFGEIEQDLDELIAINNRGAYTNLVTYGEIQRRLIGMLVLVGLVSLALTVLAGVGVYRLRGAATRAG